MTGLFSEVSENLWPFDLELPVDPVRRHFATYVTLIGWDFLLFHELGHLNRCHIQYLSSTFTPAPLTRHWLEFGTPQLSTKEAELRCVLELDADAFAGRLLAGGPILSGLESTKLFAFGATARFPWTWQEAYKTWLIPIALVFQLMAIIEDNISIGDARRTHPHPDIRLQILVNSIWPKWSEVIGDRSEFIQLTREVSSGWRTILQMHILPSLTSRAEEAYSRDFKDTVLWLWQAMMAHSDQLNDLTTRRLRLRRGSHGES